MPRIFISYRRGDSAAMAGRIGDRLVDHFGAASVFMDVDNIPPGADFRKYLIDAVNECDVLLAIIGDDWLTARHGDRRRLDDPNDFVRIEIEAALNRGTTVIPVLVGKASMPRADELPGPLGNLAYCQAAQVDVGRDFRIHIERLIRGVEGLRQETARKAAAEADRQAREQAQRQARELAERELAERPWQPAKDTTGPGHTTQPPAWPVHAQPTAPVATGGAEVRVTGHSQLLYWWPLWVLLIGYGLVVGFLSDFVAPPTFALIGGSIFLLWWAVSTFVIDPKRHWCVMTPGQLRIGDRSSGAELAYDVIGMTFSISGDGGLFCKLIVYPLLGFGAGELTMSTAHRQELKLPNVIGIRRRLRQMEDLLRARLAV